jgi:alpha-beta hydrolase superfamily lysophospholipase
MLVDLVQTTTRDGLRLDGIYQSPAPAAPADLAVAAFCLVHGTGGNFYSSTLFDACAERLARLGCAVLRVNTRGHDGINTASTARGGRRQGAAYEVVDDCRHDLAAWIDWLSDRVGPRIGLIGHSLGAVKCFYALAQEPRPVVRCLVALSPPRLSYSWFAAGPQGGKFLETYTLAERCVREGRPAELLEVKLPLPLVITAAGYVEKYGPDERYNYLRFASGAACPTLITLGSVEVDGNMAFQGAPEELTRLGQRYPHLQVELIDGADHFYTGVRPQMLDRVEAWLRAAAV